MSTNELNNVPKPAPAPQEKRRKVVVVPTVPHEGRVNLIVALMAAVVSIGAHVLLFLLMMTVGLGSAAALPTGDVVSETVVEEKKDEKNDDLTQDDIGLDPSVPTNFNVERLEDVSVPGMVNPTEAVGVVGAPEGPARTLPAPPGTGGGQGGAVFDPTQAGTGSMFGQIGGMSSGIANMGGFAGRSGATREKMLHEGGGNALSEACVAKGLSWLARHQTPNGSWSLSEFHLNAHEKASATRIFKCNCSGMAHQPDTVAATAFALLPYLAAGITHRPSKTQLKEDYYKTVLAGVEYIRSKQSVRNGSFSNSLYAHGLITIAMCEAYGLTSDPVLKLSAQKGINFIVASQDANGGGWRYAPGQAGDTSVVAWQLMALKSGQMSGLSVPYECLKKAEQFLDSAEIKNAGSAGYGYGYMPGYPAKDTMTAAALLCRMYMGVNPRNPNLLMGIDKLKAQPPSHSPTLNYYYLYYATQVMHHFGGEAWDLWNKGTAGNNGIRDILIKEMDKGLNPANNHQEGSWAPNGQGHVSAGGRIMSTSLALLCLEVYYRHLPLYRRDLGVMKMEK